MTDSNADRLVVLGNELSDAGRASDAEAAYLAATKADPNWSVPWYNLGLLCKYQKRWKECLALNQRAANLNPDDVDAWWNLGIAATALGEWKEARRAWHACGIHLPEGDGPPNADYGLTPLRLDPDGQLAAVNHGVGGRFGGQDVGIFPRNRRIRNAAGDPKAVEGTHVEIIAGKTGGLAGDGIGAGSDAGPGHQYVRSVHIRQIIGGSREGCRGGADRKSGRKGNIKGGLHFNGCRFCHHEHSRICGRNLRDVESHCRHFKQG
jgi:hypothetical protein